MKALKTFGLFLFVAGFVIFNISFFWSSYELTPTTIKNQISDSDKSDLFIKESKEIQDLSINSNFEFVS